MTAGTGADRQAQAASLQAEHKRRQLAALEQRARNWAAGAEGERLVAAELAALEGHGWRPLHDVRWPGRPRANLDHVLVGPGGVVVVDSKNWSGRVEVRGGTLRAGGYGKTRECHAVASAAAAVAALLDPRHRSVTTGVLCLVQQDVGPEPASGVTVVGRSGIREVCLARPAVLTPAEVASVHAHLQRLLTAPDGPDQWTTADVPPADGATETAAPAHAPTPDAAPLVSARFRRLVAVLVVGVTVLFWLPLLAFVVSTSTAPSAGSTVVEQNGPTLPAIPRGP